MNHLKGHETGLLEFLKLLNRYHQKKYFEMKTIVSMDPQIHSCTVQFYRVEQKHNQLFTETIWLPAGV